MQSRHMARVIFCSMTYKMAHGHPVCPLEVVEALLSSRRAHGLQWFSWLKERGI